MCVIYFVWYFSIFLSYFSKILATNIDSITSYPKIREEIKSMYVCMYVCMYLLFQHLDGKAKKIVEQLQYMVGASPQIAYNEARKKLKQRFGRSTIVARLREQTG